ncbi:MAG: class I SAM-dependent methyltransferase [Actinobacteria bacterium]|nr:class I SAM-dependent methyltransferase [Actinomycetota bacterium]
MEQQGAADHRTRLLQGLTGEVLEVGAGNGMNFRHYPLSVTRVLAVEPEPYLRRQAQRNAAAAPVPVEVVEGTAGELPVPDRSYDAVVCSLVLCSVPDQRAALVDVRRALRPGGELRFFEHVASSSRAAAAVQRALDATIWPHIGGGCHAARDTATSIAEAGFEIVELDRFRFPDGPVPTPTAPHILGRAVPA